MTDHQKPQVSETQNNLPTSSPPSSSSNSKLNSEASNANTKYSGQKVRYRNPPDATNPDAETLREQWRFAIRQYSKWYSHAWGTAILAGLSFFALGWFIKGSNPLPSRKGDSKDHPPRDGARDSDK